VVVLSGCSFAPAWPPMPMPDIMTRQEIDEYRGREDARLQQALRECYQRFAVNDCRREAYNRHREVLHLLRDQNLRLNALDREARQRKLDANPKRDAASGAVDPAGSTGTHP
jgi:hypothetical protein